jgi:predicted dehydrogenase
MDRLRIAVIGCGAVAERVHLPALARSRDAAVTVLVDRAQDRARFLASKFNIPATADDYRHVMKDIDAAVVGVPHQLHAPIAIELLDAGIHVLVEKPMALNPDECARMNAAAARSGAVLAVGLLRRCSPALRFVKQALDSGLLGRVRSFDLREGSVYRWPVASASMFRPEGGGVLADAGSHVLDLVTWWFGDWQKVVYRDDARGGVEADCLVELKMASGVDGRVELSRTREMRNACVIEGEFGTITVGTKTDSVVALTWKTGETLTGRPALGSAPTPTSLVDLFGPQFDQFVRAIRHGERPVATGVDAVRSIQLLTDCYASRQPWTMPWDAQPAPDTAPVDVEAVAGVAR